MKFEFYKEKEYKELDEIIEKRSQIKYDDSDYSLVRNKGLMRVNRLKFIPLYNKV